MPFFQENSGKKSRNKLDDFPRMLDHKYSKCSQKGKESVHNGFSPSALLLSFLLGIIFGALLCAVSLAIQLPPESIDALFLNLN